MQQNHTRAQPIDAEQPNEETDSKLAEGAQADNSVQAEEEEEGWTRRHR